MNDTRTKLETLFRRLTDPAVSDLEALEAFCWFRKEVRAHSSEDVAQALGAQGAPVHTAQASPPPIDTGILGKTPTFGKYGPKREGGPWTWGRILRDDPGYVPSLLELDDPAPWMVKVVNEVRTASGWKPNRNADYLRQEGPTT